jgi:hypothetical protein
VIVFMVLALKSHRWAQIALSIGLGACALVDITAVGYFAWHMERWAIYLTMLTVGECVVLWQLELRRIFKGGAS